MNRNAIRNYAIWARKALLEGVKQKAYAYGITEKTVTSGGDGKSPDAESAAVTADGRMLTAVEKSQRAELLREIRRKGYEQVMESSAHTWFHRFIALRFMEVNGYLPSQVRVFTDGAGRFHPDILREAMTVEMPGLDRKMVVNYLDRQDNEGLYQYLLLAQCNALHDMLPPLFDTADGYIAFLLPAGLLQEGSVLSRLVTDIPEAAWDVQALDENGAPQTQMEIIGLLYQYYNTELLDDVFGQLHKKNVKITKEHIPAATQFCTPDWIVRYMVENSLGRLWTEGHRKDENLKENWKYYVDEAEQAPIAEARLAVIRAEYRRMQLQDIQVIDPCVGSGRLLVYAFDVLMQTYMSQGYAPRDAAQSILENNLYGLDIDDQAAQLAYFTVMMKARQYDRRILTRGVHPHIYAIAESNDFQEALLPCFGTRMEAAARDDALRQVKYLLVQFFDAKEYGSLLSVEPCNWNLLRSFAADCVLDDWMDFDVRDVQASRILLGQLIDVGEVLSRTYAVVAAHPPFTGSSGLNGTLNAFLKENYAEAGYSLFAAFIKRCISLTRPCGQTAMLTQQAWMFLSGYEQLRSKLYAQTAIETMAHLGGGSFGIKGDQLGLTAFVLVEAYIRDYAGRYDRLLEEKSLSEKERAFLSEAHRYTAKSSNFSRLPDAPVVYWASEAVYAAIRAGVELSEVAEVRNGLCTGDNDRFLRLWWEVRVCDMKLDAQDREKFRLSGARYAPYNKGGAYRRWYGNNEYVVDWAQDGMKIRNFRGVVDSADYYFRECVTCSIMPSDGRTAFRFKTHGHIFDKAGVSIFTASRDTLLYIAGLANTILSQHILEVISPMSHVAGYIARLPVITMDDPSAVNALVSRNIAISKADWDAYETSWDFGKHPMI